MSEAGTFLRRLRQHHLELGTDYQKMLSELEDAAIEIGTEVTPENFVAFKSLELAVLPQ